MPATPEESIFAAAIELPDPRARDAYLAGACGPDDRLRRRVERLLSAYDDGAFLESPVANRAAHELAPAVSEQPGDTIGPYKLLEQIGEGGMGLVFMAEQSEPLRRRVALKIIKPGLDTAAVIARFEAERQALALMDHPNIAKIYDAGSVGLSLRERQSESATPSPGAQLVSRSEMATLGRPYFVMELVRGAPITDYCRDRQLDLRARLELFIDVCHAVQHAHQKGVIHRDLKPTNILVAQSDTAPVPKVIDFGVAKATTQPLTERTLFTSFAQVIGTPLYMSPEQADLGNQDVDTRSDVYSLGVVLYELLTGVTPFDAERFKNASPEEMRRIIREEEPPKPSTRATTLAAATTVEAPHDRKQADARVTALKGDLDWIVMKALDKDRRRRYESTAALAADIRRHLNDEPIDAAAPSALYLVRKFVRRHRAQTAAGVTLLAACAIGVIALVASTLAIAGALETSQEAEQQASTDRDRYRSERDRAEANLYVSDVRLAHEEWRQSNVAAAHRLLAAHLPRAGETDRRGWEWHYLDSLGRQELATLGDATTGLNLVDWSSDGRRLATADREFALHIWDAGTNREIAVLREHSASIRCLAWSPDGQRIASCDDAGVIRTWDIGLSSSAIVADLDVDVCCVAWSPDGARLASCDAAGQVILWNPAAGREILRMTEPEWAWSVAWSPDGTQLATGTSAETIRIWEASSGALLATQEDAHNHAITTVSWSPDGQRLATGSFDNVVKIWDVATWDQRSLKAHTGRVASVAWSPDGALLASAAGDGAVILWDAAKGVPLRKFLGHHGGVRNVCWDRHAARLASASWDGKVKLWDANRDQEFVRYLSGSNAAWSPDGKRLAALMPPTDDRPAAIQVADDRGQPEGAPFLVTTKHGPMTGLRPRLAWSSNGRLIAIAFSTESQLCVQVIDAAMGADVLTQTTPRSNAAASCDARSVAFSPDSSRVAVAMLNSPRNEIAVWEVATGNRIASLLSAGHSWADSLAFSPDGRRMAATYFDGPLKIWNTKTWREAMNLDRLPQDDRTHAGGAHMVAWSPDGSAFAAGNVAGQVILWDAISGREIRSFAAHPSQVFSIAFSPDGARLVTGGEDRTVKIWNPATGDHLLTLRGHEYGVRDVAWNAEGRILLSSDDDRNFLWTAPANAE